MNPFHPIITSTGKLSVTSTSGNAALTKQPSGEFHLRLYNAGPNTAFVFFGADNTTAATTSHYPIPSGAIEVITVHNLPNGPINYIAAICASTETASLYYTVGWGL